MQQRFKLSGSIYSKRRHLTTCGKRNLQVVWSTCMCISCAAIRSVYLADKSRYLCMRLPIFHSSQKPFPCRLDVKDARSHRNITSWCLKLDTLLAIQRNASSGNIHFGFSCTVCGPHLCQYRCQYILRFCQCVSPVLHFVSFSDCFALKVNWLFDYLSTLARLLWLTECILCLLVATRTHLHTLLCACQMLWLQKKKLSSPVYTN